VVRVAICVVSVSAVCVAAVVCVVAVAAAAGVVATNRGVCVAAVAVLGRPAEPAITLKLRVAVSQLQSNCFAVLPKKKRAQGEAQFADSHFV